ncbi:DinB family protein [Sporosarcina pasteurii]|nr:DinB family protein [Sporosarcina pasteurii]MDS9470759.1 DinB family protein [Sporosarcina pasteurii]
MSRMYTIGRVKRVEDSKWDYQPAGFNNNIRWHAGHIFVIVETFLQKSVKSYEPKYPEWIPMFDDGTSPSDWGEDVPSGEEILAALREQMDWVIPFIEDKLDGKMDEPLVIGDDIMTFSTIDGIVQFLSWHEGTHAGVIHALNLLEN